jgi:hypothetical protein
MAEYVTSTIETAFHRLLASPVHAIVGSWPEIVAFALGVAIAASARWRAKRWPVLVLCVALFWLLARRIAAT